MTIKLSQTQRDLLSAAAQRNDLFFILPSDRRNAAAHQAAAPLLAAGLAREVKARGDTPVWRRDKDGQGVFALKLTAAGVKAAASFVGSDGSASQKETSNKAEHEPGDSERAAQVDEGKVKGERPATLPATPRIGTKIDRVLKMLERPEGATLEAMAKATGWLTHTTSAALTGLRRRGFVLTRSRDDAAGLSVYRLQRPGQTGG